MWSYRMYHNFGEIDHYLRNNILVMSYENHQQGAKTDNGTLTIHFNRWLIANDLAPQLTKFHLNLSAIYFCHIYF